MVGRDVRGPLFGVVGTVVRGFGRGSNELGIPTANLDDATISRLPESAKTGCYFCWARINDGPVYKAVVSMGWNPFYNNKTKSLEAHLLHKFKNDFYGERIHLLILKYHREELDFPNVDALIEEIHANIRDANAFLNEPDSLYWREKTDHWPLNHADSLDDETLNNNS